jgi:hypothetical protein
MPGRGIGGLDYHDVRSDRWIGIVFDTSRSIAVRLRPADAGH